MICPKNGECMLNTMDYTGLNFCVSPTCNSPRKERMAIADKIACLLKKESLTDSELVQMNNLKSLYAISLKRGE